LIGALTVSQILRDASRIPEAIGRLKVADQTLPESLEIKYELAMLQEKQNNLKEMERLLREVIELDPGHAHAYNALGYSFADRNIRLKEASDLITRALEISPNDPFILDSMGWVKFRQGDLVDALKYLEQAYGMRPEADIAAHLGEVLWKLGRKDDARKVWSEAFAKDPKNTTLTETTRRFGWKP
jgi:tetratricopeptide (TPR) repeat protein